MAPVSALRITLEKRNAFLYEGQVNNLGGGTTVDNFELDKLKFKLLVSLSFISTVPHHQAPVVAHPYVLPLNLLFLDLLLCAGALELQVALPWLQRPHVQQYVLYLAGIG